MNTNVLDYYMIKHGVKLKDPDQPLLICTEGDQQNFLPPEICYEASLGKNFTKDRFKMKKL
jgi:hypothetical protein